MPCTITYKEVQSIAACIVVLLPTFWSVGFTFLFLILGWGCTFTYLFMTGYEGIEPLTGYLGA